MVALVLGLVLVAVAVILGVIQITVAWGINFYGPISNRLYFYGVLAVMGIVGIALSVWGLMKKATPKPIIS